MIFLMHSTIRAMVLSKLLYTKVQPEKSNSSIS